VNDWTADLMARHGMQRVLQGTDDRSPLVTGAVEKPQVSFDLLNWTPSPVERERPA
jgi:hypothetical protein